MRPPSELAAELRVGGRKVTPQRWAVVEALAEAPGEHFTAEDLYQQVRRRLPTVSRRTIYETVHLLVDLGEISSLDLGTGSTHYDTDPGLHAHAVCPGCGRIDHLALDPSALAGPRQHTVVGAWTAIIVHRACGSCCPPTRSKSS